MVGCGRPLSATGHDREGSIGHDSWVLVAGHRRSCRRFPELNLLVPEDSPASLPPFYPWREKKVNSATKSVMYIYGNFRCPILDLSPLGEIRANKQVWASPAELASNLPTIIYWASPDYSWLQTVQQYIRRSELQGPPLGMRKTENPQLCLVEFGLNIKYNSPVASLVGQNGSC